jgi:hypothetical protein
MLTRFARLSRHPVFALLLIANVVFYASLASAFA